MVTRVIEVTEFNFEIIATSEAVKRLPWPQRPPKLADIGIMHMDTRIVRCLLSNPISNLTSKAIEAVGSHLGLGGHQSDCYRQYAHAYMGNFSC